MCRYKLTITNKQDHTSLEQSSNKMNTLFSALKDYTNSHYVITRSHDHHVMSRGNI